MTETNPGEALVQNGTFERLARAGFVARGLIYGIIGLLAVKLAVGLGGKTTNQQGALRTVGHQPLGRVLLALVAVGLGSYAMWRFARAAMGHGPEDHDSGLDRLVALASGLVYAGFCVLAVEILLGSSGSSAATPHRATAGVLGWPGGPWLVGAAGVVMVGVAAFQSYRGVTHDFLGDSKTEQMTRATRMWITGIATFGYLARGVVFALVGVFLIKAAVDFDPRKAVGIDGALAELGRSPAGPVLLGTVAAGLIAFAIYSFSDARFRRI